MLTLPVNSPLSLPTFNMSNTSFQLAQGKMYVNMAELREVVDSLDVQYLHLSSSASLAGMIDSRLPAELHGSLLPLGKLAEYGITPNSGEGGGDDERLVKHHAVSVCSTIDLDDAMGTLAAYSGTPDFITSTDFPVLFAIHNLGSITSHFDDASPVIDPPGKMDASEFAIRGGVASDDIRAIIVPEGFEGDACRLLSGLPDMQNRVCESAG